GAVRFSASIGVAAGPLHRAPEGEPPREPWDGPALYGPASVFPGPQFRVVRSVAAVSRDRARGTLAGAGAAGWPTDLHIDPAAIDGAFQLAMLFGLRGGGGPRLPLRIERLVFHHSPDGELRCELTERSRNQERLLCDLSLASTSGEPVADLLGVEMFAVPSGTTAGCGTSRRSPSSARAACCRLRSVRPSCGSWSGSGARRSARSRPTSGGSTARSRARRSIARSLAEWVATSAGSTRCGIRAAFSS